MSKNYYQSSSHSQVTIQDNNQSDKKGSQATGSFSSLSDFKVLSKLGEGAYSSVYKVLRLADMKEYALKKVKLLNLSEKERENALNEVRILASVKQKNVISYKEAFWDNEAQSLCIVMEYADNGDLFQKICDHQKKNTEFQENEIWKVFIQVVKAMKALHDMRIMHRDLKVKQQNNNYFQSANVFLYKDWTAKLGDMNVSKISNYKGLNYTQTGTPYYASPEVWKDEPYDSKSDIWSLGCVLYEMITLKPPFRADDMQGLYKKVLKGVYQKIPSTFSSDLSQVVSQLLQVKPHLRPSCDQILDMPSVVKRNEKYFPEETFNDKSTLVQEIRVPKNFMYLTDKLPAANYSETPKNMFKNKSESKLKLPKLTNSVINSSSTATGAQLEYQLPQIRQKKNDSNNNQLQNQKSIQDQVESQSIATSTQKKNIQQQQIIIQVKQPSQKKQIKISSLQGNSINISTNEKESQQTQNQKESNEQNQKQLLMSPNTLSQKQQQTKLQQDDLKISKGKNKSQSSSRAVSARKEPNSDEIQIKEERVSVLSQRYDQNDETKDHMDDLPPPIQNSKSPNLKQLVNPKLSRNNAQTSLGENDISSNQKLTSLTKNTQHTSQSMPLLSEEDTAQKQQNQYGYRYASLSPLKRNEVAESQQTPSAIKIQKLPQVNSPDLEQYPLVQNKYNGTRSLSPYRNPSLIQPIQSKQELSKLKQSVLLISKAPSANPNKLPKLSSKASEAHQQILRSLQQHHKSNYYYGHSKSNQNLQNMYYRVANSYLKNYHPPLQMNIIGSSVKNSYQQIYGGNLAKQQSMNSMDDQMPNLYYNKRQSTNASLIGTIEKTRPIIQETSKNYIQNIISNENIVANNQSIIHPLLSRPSRKIRNGSLEKIKINDKQLISNGSVNSEGIQMGSLPKNQSQVLLKYQIQETKQQVLQ